MSNTKALVGNGEPQMHEREARECVNRIRAGLEDIQKLAYELYEREGWRALGYGSWRECVAAEFDQAERHLYRLADTERVRRVLTRGSNEEVDINERQARALAPLSKSDPEAARAVWDKVTKQHGSMVTAEKIEKEVKKRKPTQKKSKRTQHLPSHPCETCGASFGMRVWHCADCGEHNLMSEKRCPVCDPEDESLANVDGDSLLCGLRDARRVLVTTRDTTDLCREELDQINGAIRNINRVATRLKRGRDPAILTAFTIVRLASEQLTGVHVLGGS